MSTFVPLIVIGLAIIVILAIIVRKFPALAILDVENIPGEKESKFKEQIMKSRVERDLAFFSGYAGRVWLWISKRFGSVLKSQHDKLKRVRITYKAAAKISWEEKQLQIQKLIAESEEAIKEEEEAEAEEKLLEAVSLDQKNLAAFFRLGRLYEDQKKWTEARETLQYALKLSLKRPEKSVIIDGAELSPDVTAQEIYFLLADVEKEMGDIEAALENIREALELEPASPRYLDLILDLSIIKKDRALAVEYWQKLAAVNPENKKLEEWQKKITDIPE